MSQSIDLSNLGACNFNGSTVSAINLNGSGIWTGARSVNYIYNPNDDNENRYTYVSSGFGQALTQSLTVYNRTFSDSNGYHLGINVSISASLGIMGGSDYTIDMQSIWKLHRVGTIGAGGVVTNQRVMGWYYYDAGNPGYGIPGSRFYYYAGFVGQNYVVGSRRIDQSATSALTWSTVQSFYNDHQSFTHTNGENKATLTLDTTDPGGPIWKAVTNGLTDKIHLTQQNGTGPYYGIVWS